MNNKYFKEYTKCGVISEGISNLVPSSKKKPVPELFYIDKMLRDSDLVHFFEDETELKNTL